MEHPVAAERPSRQPDSPASPARYRMRDLVRESGLPRETIHYYLAEGLLPPPLKTGRNTALYSEDHLYRLTFDGSIADEHGFVVMGGQADKVSAAIAEGWRGSLTFADAVRLAVSGLAPASDTGEAAKALPVSAVEVAVLDRLSETLRGTRRAFRRLNDADITALLA